MVTQIVLILLGVAVGATAFNPYESDPTAGYGTGAGIWVGISALISAFVGACVAGRLSGGPRSTDGMLHGVVCWSAATLLTVFLLTTAVGNLLGGAANVLGRMVSTGTQQTAATGSGASTLESMKQQLVQQFPQASQFLPPTGREDASTNLFAQAARNPELMSALTSMEKKGGPEAAPQERDRAISILVNQGASEQEAAAMVNSFHQQYQSAQLQAREAGEKVSTGMSAAAWGGFALLIISAALAAWGGWLGTRGLSYIQHERAAAEGTA
jgi:hypothetical protein